MRRFQPSAIRNGPGSAHTASASARRLRRDGCGSRQLQPARNSCRLSPSSSTSRAYSRRRRCEVLPHPARFSPSTVINDARQRWLFRMVQAAVRCRKRWRCSGTTISRRRTARSPGTIGGAEATRMMAAKRPEHPADCPASWSCSANTRCRTFAICCSRSRRIRRCSSGSTAGRTSKARPQENFAREIMELFTIGVGQFTEADVYAGARVFTGWNLQRIGDAEDPNSFYQFIYNAAPARHERQDVQLSDLRRRTARRFPRAPRAAGMQDGIDLIAALARHPETAAASCAPPVGVFRQRSRAAPNTRFVDQIATVYLQSRLPYGARGARPCCSRASSMRRRAISRATRGPSNTWRVR